MSRFLLDANLSPKTRVFLTEQFALDAVDITSLHLGMLPDDEVVALAKREHRVIITFDQDFGEIYYLQGRGTFGTIVLQLADQTVEAVNVLLGHFFTSEAQSIDLDSSLIVLREDHVRIVRSQ